MHAEEAPVNQVVERLTALLGPAPPTAIVLGSGLGPVVDRMKIEAQGPFEAFSLPISTVRGHASRVIRGRLGDAPVVVLSGRVHLYEGYSADQVVRGVRALHRWGVKRLILTCSVGGISAGLEPGSLVLLSDHINFQGDNPLRGEAWGATRFPDLTFGYHPELRGSLREAARRVGVSLADGVYAAMMGPSYETPAEIRMLRTIGADVVGMSTVSEILAAAQVGLPAAAVAVVSNRAAGLTGAPLTHEEVTDIAGRAASGLASLLEVACAGF
jgi:purine-nucleoside phosphorylase